MVSVTSKNWVYFLLVTFISRLSMMLFCTLENFLHQTTRMKVITVLLNTYLYFKVMMHFLTLDNFLHQTTNMKVTSKDTLGLDITSKVVKLAMTP